MTPASACTCPHHKVGAILVMLIGIAVLLVALGTISMVTGGVSVAVLLILQGLTRLIGGSCKCYMQS